MDDDKVLELTTKMESTLGKDNFATISDTVGELLTGNTMNMKTIAEKEAEIANLKEKNEKLVAANGALLQKIPIGIEEKPVEKSVEKPVEKISWDKVFDKKGNFIR